MASAVERYTPNGRGMRGVLRSQGVRGMLLGRALRVKAAADSMMHDHTEAWDRGIVADSTVGSGRASATVIGLWHDVEAEHRILGTAIDAAG